MTVVEGEGRVVSLAMLEDATCAWEGEKPAASDRVRLIAALTAANVYEPELLDGALQAFGGGAHLERGLRQALAYALAWQEEEWSNWR